MRRLLPFIGFVVLMFVCLLLWRWSLPAPVTPTAVVTRVVTVTYEGYPTGSGTAVPTETPTETPTAVPTASPSPTSTPIQPNTPEPTAVPTAVPTLTSTPEPTAVELPEFYVVRKDDWLIRIAMRLYGSPYGWEWRCLYERNRGVIGENPHLIYRGQVLVGIRGCGE